MKTRLRVCLQYLGFGVAILVGSACSRSKPVQISPYVLQTPLGHRQSLLVCNVTVENQTNENIFVMTTGAPKEATNFLPQSEPGFVAVAPNESSQMQVTFFSFRKEIPEEIGTVLFVAALKDDNAINRLLSKIDEEHMVKMAGIKHACLSIASGIPRITITGADLALFAQQEE